MDDDSDPSRDNRIKLKRFIYDNIEEPRQITIGTAFERIIEEFPDFEPEYNGKIGTLIDLNCEVYVDSEIGITDMVLIDRTTGVSYDLRTELMMSADDLI